MKFFSLLLFAGIILCFFGNVPTARAQRSARRVHFDFISKDSIVLAMNEDFELIEDSCSQIKRFAHINMGIGRKYVGKITDVSRLDPKLVLTEGAYNEQGEKNGPFITHYLNGQLQAKGSYAKDKYDGKWELYYDDGKPRLNFEANGNDIKITDAWDAKGVKTVSDGKGTYRVDMGPIYWKGKLLNGKPDGTWGVAATDDVTGTQMATERYKDGAFVKGKSPIGDYTDAPRFTLTGNNLLPFTHAEALKVSTVPCNGEKAKHIVGVQYKDGMEQYSDELIRVVAAYFYYIDIKHFTNHFSIEGYVNDQGFLTNLESFDSFNQDISGGLIKCLKRAPALSPATVNGKPTRQKVAFNFTFSEGLYKFNYGFGDVDVK